MDFKTTDFILEVENINYFLGLPKDIYTEAYKKDENYIKWKCELETREWGIKGLHSIVDKIKLNIEWEIMLEDLTPQQINKLPEDTEFTPNYARGTITNFREFNVISDFTSHIERVDVDFLTNEIIVS